MLPELATGFALGLSLAGPPGPVNALIAREAVRGGTWAGIRAGYPALSTCLAPSNSTRRATRVPRIGPVSVPYSDLSDILPGAVCLGADLSVSGSG